jgi:Tetratricopeptide repeat
MTRCRWLRQPSRAPHDPELLSFALRAAINSGDLQRASTLLHAVRAASPDDPAVAALAQTQQAK